MSRQQFEYHPVLGHRFIPGLRARIQHEAGGYLVRVNDAGFRCNRDVAAPRAPGSQRVLVFGDSFTAGDGVPNEQRYSDRLEHKIPGLEVYNFGLPGSGTDQQHLAYREYGRTLDHDAVIIAVLVENIRRIGARYRPYRTDDGRIVYAAKPYYELEGGTLTLRNVPVPRTPLPEDQLPSEALKTLDRGGRYPTLRRLATAAGLLQVAQRATGYQPVPEFNDPHDARWQLMAAILRQWMLSASRPTLLVPVPLYHHVEETSDATAYRARFQELARETGCTLHDPLPDLLRYPLDERRRFRFEKDVHPTPACHEALACSLAPPLMRLLSGARETTAHG